MPSLESPSQNLIQRDRHGEYILRNEPLRRGTGKPHIVEELYRVAGELVYVCPKYPNGVSEWQYQRMIKQDRKAAQWRWQAQRRNPRVYARRRVRHPDHATITLSDWHRVVMNTETETDTMRNVTFIDQPKHNLERRCQGAPLEPISVL